MSEATCTSLFFRGDADNGASTVLAGAEQLAAMAGDAARACQVHGERKQFDAQFHELLRVLREWLEARREKVKSARLSARDTDLLFLVMQKQARFDPDLADALSELDLKVANSRKLNMVDLEVLAVPPVSEDSLQSLLASREAAYQDAK
jgi:hypothetical protein